MNNYLTYNSTTFKKILGFAIFLIFIYATTLALNIGHGSAAACSYPADDCGYFYENSTAVAGDKVFACGLATAAQAANPADTPENDIGSLSAFETLMDEWVNPNDTADIPTTSCGQPSVNGGVDLQYQTGAAYIIETMINGTKAGTGATGYQAAGLSLAETQATEPGCVLNSGSGTNSNPNCAWQQLMYDYATYTSPSNPDSAGNYFSVNLNYYICNPVNPSDPSYATCPPSETGFCTANTLYQIPGDGVPAGDGDVAYFDDSSDCSQVYDQYTVQFTETNIATGKVVMQYTVKKDCGNPVGTVVIQPPTHSSGALIIASCNPPELEGDAYNTDAPGQIEYEIYVNQQQAGGIYETSIISQFDLTGSQLPAELTDLEATGGSAQVTIWSPQYYLGEPVPNSWEQVAGPATFSCSTTPTSGTLQASCTAATPYVSGTLTNSDVPSGSSIQFYIYADGDQAGNIYTSNNSGSPGNFDITGANLPTALTSLEGTAGTTQVTIWAESYAGGTPVRGSLTQVAGPITWNCSVKPTGTMSLSCSANPPYVKGTVADTDAPANSLIAFYIYVNGAPQEEYNTTTTGTFSESGLLLPPDLVALEGTSTSATVTIWAESYSRGNPIANSWTQVAGPQTWQCVVPSGGSVTASCTANPPSITGDVYNTDAPATAVTFYIYVNGLQAAGPFTTTQPSPPGLNAQYGLSGNHGFSITALIPNSLKNMENTNNNAAVTIWAESYSGGAPIAGSLAQVAAGTWQCMAPPTIPPIGGILSATCTSQPPAVTGYIFDTDVPATAITFYLYVNGMQAAGPFTTTQPSPAGINAQYGLTGNHGFSITTLLPASLTSLEGTNQNASVTIWAESYALGNPVAPLQQVGAAAIWQCVAPPPAPGNITGNCSLVQRTFTTAAESPYPTVTVSFAYQWDPLSGPSNGVFTVTPADTPPSVTSPTGLADPVWQLPTTPGTGILIPNGGATEVTTTGGGGGTNTGTWQNPDATAPTMPANLITTYQETLYSNPQITSTAITINNPTKGGKPATEKGTSVTLSYTITVHTFEFSSWTYYVDPPNAQQFSVLPMFDVTDNQGGAGSAALDATNCDENEPFLSTPVASCVTGNFSFLALDEDHALPADDIYYSVDGSAAAPDPSNNSLNMSTYDQLVAHSVTITMYDVNILGNTNYPVPNEGWGTITTTVTYPKCYTVTCGIADVPATVESSDNGPTPIYFKVSVNLGFTPTDPGEPATPTTIDGVLADQFASETGIPPDVVNSGILLNKFLSPATGDYTFTWTFVDPNGPSVSCTLPHLVVVAVQPYIRVYNGDVSAGNGFITTLGTLSCSQTGGAGIISWNDDVANAYAGAGTQLAATAIGNIEGFVSADGAANGLLPTDLSFGNNSLNVSGDNYGGDYNGLLQCNADYYYTPIAKTATYYYCSGTATINAGQLSGCTNQATGASGPFDLTALTNATVVKAAAGVIVSCPSASSPCSGPAYAANTPWATAGGLLTVPSLYVETLGNIYISPTVDTINGAYIAQGSGSGGGTIYTCATAAGNPNPSAATYYKACDYQLIVDGALVANQIEFGRTFGTAGEGLAGDTAEAPGQGWNYAAEVINYSPDIWLSDPYASTQSPYEAVTSLPPVL